MTWDEIIEQVAKQLHEGTMQGTISPDMVKHTARELMNGAFKGYGKDFDSKGLGATDFEQLRAIEKNVFVFSGFKNHQQLKEASLLLKDANGELRSFNDFFKDLKVIDKTYNRHYAEAEYNHAQNTSNAISRWKEIQEQKDALRFLTWRTVSDEHNCPVCGVLNGTHLPVDHAFWRTHFYPAHFNCRCVVEQSDDETLVTPDDKIPAPDYPKNWDMFKHNAGIDGVVFPKKHPYYEASKAAAAQINKEVTPLIPVRELQQVKFTPAKTIKEAERFALENELAAKVSYKGINLPDIANAVNKQLLELKQQHGIVYDEVKTVKRTTDGVAYTLMSNRTLMNSQTGKVTHILQINKAYFEKFKSIDEITEDVMKMRTRQWTTGENLNDVVNHEIGHRLTLYNTFKDKMSKYESLIFDYERLGRYATKNLDETLAEIYCFYKKTGGAPQAWLDKFNKYSELKLKND